ncbi:ATP-binding cassette domain-containing protein [Synechococcus sp. RSCCF101]|uniref:ATP-binding cassette domain-containing protein n=1 Tax=Synechococcus sp. RSCCF101 TaxID=2511069 RepID=UPI00177EF3DD|nr:ATP-binding cassette domain-containing protein [Synechococcus sp. RSCCF101]
MGRSASGAPQSSLLWVAGMHRSGTSLLTRCLLPAGVRLPPNLLPPTADNPEGFQESADFVAVNESILALQESPWDASWAMDPCRRTSLSPSLEMEAEGLIRRWMEGDGPLALKDPRLCRTLPFWHRLLGPARMAAGVAIVRHPLAVVQSIGYRDDMPAVKALSLWLRHNLELIGYLRREGLAWPIVSFERLVVDAGAELARLEHLAWHGEPLFQRRELPRCPERVEEVPPDLQALALRFHRGLSEADRAGAVREGLLQDVEASVNGDPHLLQQLLALESRRRHALGDALAEERGRAQLLAPELDEAELAGLEGPRQHASAEQLAQWRRDDVPFHHLDGVQLRLRGRAGRERGGREPGTGEPRAVLSDITLTISGGQRVGLLGHNGSGKTSLLRLLSGIYQPTGGTLSRHGEPLAPIIDQSLGYSRELTGLQCCRHYHLLHLADQVEWPAFLARVQEFTELGEALATPLKTWSLGMQTRLSFALTTGRRVQGLALDEGLGAGDQWFQRKARRQLDAFIDRAGTLVLASHSNVLLQRYCSRGIILEQGRIRFEGTLFRALQLYKGMAA